MPRIRIPLPHGAFDRLIDKLDTTVGPRDSVHHQEYGKGWRFVRKEDSVLGVSFVHWDREVIDGDHVGSTSYYLLEIDDPKLATFFTLKYA